MNRRRLVRAAAGPATAALAGCLGALDAVGVTSGDRERTLYPDDREVPPEADTHDLYVENFDRVDREVALQVVRADDDALVWGATYEVPDRRGLEIPDLLVDGRSYEVAVDVTDGPTASETVSVDPCPNSGDSRNAGVWLEGGSVTVRQDACDEILVGSRLSYADHERFLVEPSA